MYIWRRQSCHSSCLRPIDTHTVLTDALADDDITTSCDQAMLELEAAAVDLEASSPVACDWDFTIYNLGDPLLEGGGGGGGEPPAGGDESGGGGGGEPPDGRDGGGGGGGGEPPAGGDGGGGGGGG